MVSDHLTEIVLSLELDVLEVAPAPGFVAKGNVKMKSFANVRLAFSSRY